MSRSRTLRVAVERALWAAFVYPWLMCGLLHATWLVAWAVLGHVPRASIDDPKFISAWVDAPAAVCAVLIGLSPLALGIGVLCAVLMPWWRHEKSPRAQSSRTSCVVPMSPPRHERPSRRYVLMLALVLALCVQWGLVVWLLRADPLGVLEWFVD